MYLLHASGAYGKDNLHLHSLVLITWRAERGRVRRGRHSTCLDGDAGREHLDDALQDCVHTDDAQLERGRLFTLQQLKVKQIIDNPRLQTAAAGHSSHEVVLRWCHDRCVDQQ